VKDIFAGKERTPLVILPENVRNALAYKGAQLGQKEIISLQEVMVVKDKVVSKF
jgi:hypothetical protein